MLTLYIADVERDAGMKKLSREEATKVLEGMKVKIEIPKAAVTQWKRNAALDMAIEVLNCSEIPNKSDTISRQAALDAIMRQPPEPHYPSWYAAQIEILPSAQPEIIRCKDCRFNDGTAYCLFHFRDVKGEGYCSWAERRTDG